MDAEIRRKVRDQAGRLREASERMTTLDQLHGDDDPTWFLTLAKTIGDVRQHIEELEKALAIEAVTTRAAKAPDIANNLGRSKMAVYKWARAETA